MIASIRSPTHIFTLVARKRRRLFTLPAAARRLLISFLLLVAVSPLGAFAQEPPSKTLTVVIKPVKPFVFEEAGDFQGYSIDLWKRVAQEAGLAFEFKMVKTLPEVMGMIKDRTADVGIGALSVTAEREAVIDFSQSIFDESGFQILANARDRSSIRSAFREFLSFDVLKLVGILLFALLAIGHLLWFTERRKNPESFPESYPAGVIEATWWSVSTLITAGCENISPRGVTGRLLAIVWMLASLALVSLVTATLAAKLTADKLTTDIKGLGDLQGATTGSVVGSTAASFLQKRNLTLKGYDTIEGACTGLAKGEVKAVLYDAPILRYYLHTNPGSTLTLVGERFERHNYAFGLQSGSPYRKQINRTLLELREKGFLDELQTKWFAKED